MNLLQMPKALNLKNFLEHFVGVAQTMTHRIAIAMPLFLGMNKAKISHKILSVEPTLGNLSTSLKEPYFGIHFRYGTPDLFRFRSPEL